MAKGRSKKLPSEVKVFGKVYAIEFVELPLDETAVYGVCDHRGLTIRINAHESIHLSQQRETLWHEIKHAIWSEMDVDSRDEESWVRPMSSGEFAVMVDNPKLMDWIIKK
tara:strand:+ start:282 stop:611 length:330 start_codon:yes stop_codon:yes gene_type:complete